MSDFGTAQYIELLGVARARTTDEGSPIVVVTIRPQPDRSWAYHHLSMSIAQAERLRDDLANLLKAPATFLLLVVLALTGCSARVEVSNEKLAAVESDSASAPPAVLERSRTIVEVDVERRQPEPAVERVANENPSPAEVEDEPDERGDVTLIVVKQVHKHRHYHLPVLADRQHWPSPNDEAERLRRFHEMKKRQYGYR